MRFSFLAPLLAIVTASGCTLWDPDHEPDPDASLHDLLVRIDDGTEPLDAIERERMRFAVERLAIRHPGHVPSQVAASALAFESGEPQRAQLFADRALSLEPGNVEARCLRVRIAVADGSLDLARKLVDDGLRLRPDAAALYESSAWLLQLDGRADDALRALDGAESLNAPAWRVSYHRGLIEELRGNLDLAEEHYRKALGANGACAEARQRIAGIAATRRVGGGR